MTDVRHILVLPDRDSAEEVAEELKHRYELARRGGEPEPGGEGSHAGVRDEGPYPEPQLVREALAGEDDAEDAQWLVVLECPADDAHDGDGAAGADGAHGTDGAHGADGAHPRGWPYDPESLDALAGEYEGWLERD